MKKSLLTLAIVLLAVAAQAQFKMHNSGRISFQSLIDSPSYGVTIDPAPSYTTNFNGNAYFNSSAVFDKPVNPYNWMNCAKTNGDHALTWVVTPDWSTTNFYVCGDGIAYATNHYTITNNPGHAKGSEAIDGEEALSIILGLNGYYYEPEE